MWSTVFGVMNEWSSRIPVQFFKRNTLWTTVSCQQLVIVIYRHQRKYSTSSVVRVYWSGRTSVLSFHYTLKFLITVPEFILINCMRATVFEGVSHLFSFFFRSSVPECLIPCMSSVFVIIVIPSPSHPDQGVFCRSADVGEIHISIDDVLPPLLRGFSWSPSVRLQRLQFSSKMGFWSNAKWGRIPPSTSCSAARRTFCEDHNC